MGVWNDYANKLLLDRYVCSLSSSPIILDKITGKLSWDTPKQVNNTSNELKTLCLYELSKELELKGFEVKSYEKWAICVSKGFWKITLKLEYSLPYSDALVKSIINNYKHSKGILNVK